MIDKDNLITDYKCSVIIATFNRSAALCKAIQSILNQSYQNFEIIVVDDASTDVIKEIIDRFTDPKIKYFRNDRNSGLSAARNVGIRMATGEFLILMDDDSILKSNFLEVLDKATRDNEVNVYAARILDPVTNKPFIDFFLNNQNKYLGYFEFNYFLGGGHVFRKNVISALGLYDERFGLGSRYGAAEESDYFFKIKRCGEKVLYYPDLIIYHPRDGNPSDSKVFNYSYAISAMLTKNLLHDLSHFYIYFLIIGKRIMISLLRTIQLILFPQSIGEKNKSYKYRYFLKGTINGIFGYLMHR